MFTRRCVTRVGMGITEVVLWWMGYFGCVETIGLFGMVGANG